MEKIIPPFIGSAIGYFYKKPMQINIQTILNDAKKIENYKDIGIIASSTVIPAIAIEILGLTDIAAIITGGVCGGITSYYLTQKEPQTNKDEYDIEANNSLDTENLSPKDDNNLKTANIQPHSILRYPRYSEPKSNLNYQNQPYSHKKVTVDLSKNTNTSSTILTFDDTPEALFISRIKSNTGKRDRVQLKKMQQGTLSKTNQTKKRQPQINELIQVPTPTDMLVNDNNSNELCKQKLK